MAALAPQARLGALEPLELQVAPALRERLAHRVQQERVEAAASPDPLVCLDRLERPDRRACLALLAQVDPRESRASQVQVDRRACRGLSGQVVRAEAREARVYRAPQDQAAALV